MGSGCVYQGTTFTGTWEPFWLDGLPATTNDSYGYNQGDEPRFTGCKFVTLITESWLLLIIH